MLGTLYEALKSKRRLSQEYRLRRSVGVYRWMFDVASLRVNADGSFRGFIGSANDTTDQKLAQQALGKVSGQLIQARLRRLLACSSLSLALFGASLAELDAETPHAEEPKGVLLLYQNEMGLPGERAADTGVRSVLGNKAGIQIYNEHLDNYLFPDPKFRAAQVAWFRSKYWDRKIDLIITTGLLSQTIFPDKPTVFCGVERSGLSDTILPPNATAVWLSPDFKGTLAAAARLQPRAHQVVVLSGTSDFDRHLEMGLRNTPPPPGSNWEVNYWDKISVEEIRSRLAALPKDTIVLFLSIERDGAGRPYVPRDLIPSLSAASSAPMYGLSDGFIGFGIVGGAVVSFEAEGRQAAEFGQRILRGEKPADIPPIAVASSYVFDWRQLRRFGLSESALPAGSIVRFAIPSPWDLYKRWIVSGVAFILLQTSFIGYLLVQRRRRRRAENLLAYELRFESLLSSLSATFANVPTERTSTEIENALEKLRAFLDLDRVSLFESTEADGPFEISYSASAAATPRGPRTFSRDEFPWIVANLLQGKDCVIRSGEDLPPDGQKERAFFLEKDYRFVALVPLHAACLTVGSLALISYHEGTWPDEVIRQIRVIAEVFANILARKRIEDGLQESQQRFQTMADTAPVMIWMSGADKLRTFFNRQWLEFTGRSLDQELGNGWSKCLHPDDLEQSLGTYVSSFDARRSFTMEFRMRRANGEYGWVFDTGVPRYTPAGEFIGFIGSCTDITERRSAEQGLLDLSGRLISAQEDERARIARELHDDFSQRLALLAMQLGQVGESLPSSNKAASERLNTMWNGISELSSDIHRLSHQLHSSKLHHVGLLAAARSLCDETGEQHRIQIEFVHREIPEEISPDVELCFFRIVQEALNNIVKHSGAKQAHVEFVGTASHIRLRIVDGGVGFDPSAKAARAGLGLASMRERLRLLGGTIVLRSRPMEGTEIVAEVPQTHSITHAYYP
jgi:PAS domain S-box-containing protein